MNGTILFVSAHQMETIVRPRVFDHLITPCDTQRGILCSELGGYQFVSTNLYQSCPWLKPSRPPGLLRATCQESVSENFSPTGLGSASHTHSNYWGGNQFTPCTIAPGPSIRTVWVSVREAVSVTIRRTWVHRNSRIVHRKMVRQWRYSSCQEGYLSIVWVE